MASENIVDYRDSTDDAVYSIDVEKYATINDSMKRHVMKNLLRVYDQNLDFMTLSQVEGRSGKAKRSSIGGHSSPSPFSWGQDTTERCPLPKEKGLPFKFDLGCLPSDDFRFSSDTSSVPAFYRQEHTATPLPRVWNFPGVSAPINVLVGNLAVIKQSPNALLVAAPGLYSTQTPSQSFFTYFYGSIIDQYYQVMRFTKEVSVWPVGLVGGLMVEKPILNLTTGKVVGWNSAWRPDRAFPIDMAGFAINLQHILKKSTVFFSYSAPGGFLESTLLGQLTTRDHLEPKADNCTQVLVWHTRTEAPRLHEERKLNNRGIHSDVGMEV